MNTCKADGCERGILAKGYCNRHYKQIQNYGEIIRTRYDSNEIIIKDNVAEVVLYNSKGIEKSRALIDIEDINLVKNYKWCYKEGYAMSKPKGKNVLLHRLIMDAPDDKVVDHKNHNTLDNRKGNLRICTTRQNNWNLKDAKGVYYRKTRNSWRAKIMVNGKSIYLGTYKSEEEAKQARILAEIEYFGEFAPNRRNA